MADPDPLASAVHAGMILQQPSKDLHVRNEQGDNSKRDRQGKRKLLGDLLHSRMLHDHANIVVVRSKGHNREEQGAADSSQDP